MDDRGKQVSGIVDADSAKAAKAKLRRENKFPIELSEVSEEKKVKGKGLSMEINLRMLRGKVKINEMAIMTRQFATLVGAGIPVVESLTALSKQVEDDRQCCQYQGLQCNNLVIILPSCEVQPGEEQAQQRALDHIAIQKTIANQDVLGNDIVVGCV